jgi:glycosyltransferase involved in cell wall biosynthesis
MKKISIIVPVYKVEKYLDKCVESLVNQTYKNLEIILVDDGSPDECPKICDAWAKKDSRIKVSHKANGGLSEARNTGMDIATGDYIGFVDSDDYVSEEMYNILVKIIEENDADISACQESTFNDESINCLIGKTVEVVPVVQDELYSTLQNPFKGPSERRVIRVDVGGKVALRSKYPIKEYTITYISNPTPIVLEDLSEYELSIEGISTESESTINPILHSGEYSSAWNKYNGSFLLSCRTNRKCLEAHLMDR